MKLLKELGELILAVIIGVVLAGVAYLVMGFVPEEMLNGDIRGGISIVLLVVTVIGTLFYMSSKEHGKKTVKPSIKKKAVNSE